MGATKGQRHLVGSPSCRIKHFTGWFGKSTTIICVSNTKDMHSYTHTLRFHRWQTWQREWQSDESGRMEE